VREEKTRRAIISLGVQPSPAPRLTPRRVAPSDASSRTQSRGTLLPRACIHHPPLAISKALGVCSRAPARAVAAVVVRVAAGWPPGTLGREGRHAPISPTDSDGTSRGRARRAAAAVNKTARLEAGQAGRESATSSRNTTLSRNMLLAPLPDAGHVPGYPPSLSPENSGGIREPMLIRYIQPCRVAPVSSGRGNRNGKALSAGASSARRAQFTSAVFLSFVQQLRKAPALLCHVSHSPRSDRTTTSAS
jgi:hypothetical protein